MQDKKIVIGIAGNIGTGKGTVASYLTKQYQAVNVRYSHILFDILSRMHLTNGRENFAHLAEGLRSAFGADILSAVLAKDIKTEENKMIVFDGIRKKAELDYFKGKVENFAFIFVDVSIETAHKRLVKREEKIDDASKTLEAFKIDYKSPADRDVPALKNVADYVIDNSGELEETYEQIDEIIKNLKRKIEQSYK